MAGQRRAPHTDRQTLHQGAFQGHHRRLVAQQGLQQSAKALRALACDDQLPAEKLIGEALQRGHLTGGQRLANQVEAILSRRIGICRTGRPRKQDGLNEFAR